MNIFFKDIPYQKLRDLRKTLTALVTYKYNKENKR